MEDERERIKKLLNLLYKDSNMKLKNIVEELEKSWRKVSRQTIANDIKDIKEKKEKIISGFSIIENPNLQNIRTFFIEIKTNPEESEIIPKLKSIQGIRAIDGIIGPTSLIIKFCIPFNQGFDDILNKIGEIITKTRFRYYKIIDCLKTYKKDGVVFSQNTKEIINITKKEATLLRILTECNGIYSDKDIHDQIILEFPKISLLSIKRQKVKLKEMGLIHSFSIKISPTYILQTEFRYKFYLQIIPKNLSKYDSLAKLLIEKNEIVECYRTGQEYGILAVVRTMNIPKYNNLIKSLYETGEIQDSISTLVIDEQMPAIFKPFRE
ncbi:MAG: Lrp/AsnC family transcriptional regulator [archaeon]|nr:Lrp/AsnC family transcriptional regulator [archaeon]